jgi:ferredoxin-NADP reductase
MGTRGVSSGTRTTEAPVRIAWQNATITRIVEQTPSIRSFFLRLPAPFSYEAGQHVDVKLTAPDGYVAMRSYSIASAPDSTDVIELAIERLPDGEVSPFFHDVAQPGDEIELRGPLGGHFIWPRDTTEPVLLIGAGSGVVPLMAMIRARRIGAQAVPTALLLSSRTWRDVLFRDELLLVELVDSRFSLSLTLTREAPMRGSDFGRRIDASMVEKVIGRLPGSPRSVFVCGSNAFVDVAADSVLATGIVASSIRTERYGGT